MDVEPDRSVLRSPEHVRVAVGGDIDILTAPELHRQLLLHLGGLPPGGTLVVDLSQVTHFSAAGVSVLVVLAGAARDRGVALRLGRVPSRVERLLGACGVDFPRLGDR